MGNASVSSVCACSNNPCASRNSPDPRPTISIDASRPESTPNRPAPAVSTSSKAGVRTPATSAPLRAVAYSALSTGSRSRRLEPIDESATAPGAVVTAVETVRDATSVAASSSGINCNISMVNWDASPVSRIVVSPPATSASWASADRESVVSRVQSMSSRNSTSWALRFLASFSRVPQSRRSCTPSAVNSALDRAASDAMTMRLISFISCSDGRDSSAPVMPSESVGI